jgi:hypothetical protein
LGVRFLSDDAAPTTTAAQNKYANMELCAWFPFIQYRCPAHVKSQFIDATIPSPPPEGLLYSLAQEDIDRFLKPMYTRKWGVKWNNRQL